MKPVKGRKSPANPLAVNAVALPAINPAVVDALVDMLQTDQGMTRPPEKAAALLALIIELHRRNRPFPERRDVANLIAKVTDGRCSIYTVDAALSTRTQEGYITPVIDVEEGSVSARHSVVKFKRYVPSKRLIAVADRVTKKRPH